MTPKDQPKNQPMTVYLVGYPDGVESVSIHPSKRGLPVPLDGSEGKVLVDRESLEKCLIDPYNSYPLGSGNGWAICRYPDCRFEIDERGKHFVEHDKCCPLYVEGSEPYSFVAQKY